jgi:hypothetical protein
MQSNNQILLKKRERERCNVPGRMRTTTATTTPSIQQSTKFYCGDDNNDDDRTVVELTQQLTMRQSKGDNLL